MYTKQRFVFSFQAEAFSVLSSAELWAKEAESDGRDVTNRMWKAAGRLHAADFRLMLPGNGLL